MRRSAPGDVNEGFLRDDAEITFLLMSDNPDISASKGVTAEMFLERLHAHQPDREKVAFHFLWSQPLAGFDLILDELEGLRWSWDQVPYAPLFTAIAQSVDRTNRFRLDGVPDPDTLWVTVHADDGSVIELPADAVRYDPVTHEVDLEPVVPDEGAAVDIRYVPADG